MTSRPPLPSQRPLIRRSRPAAGRREDALTPDVRQGHMLYDSSVNDVSVPQIFVTYHDAQAFPEFLIKFKTEGH